MTKNCMFCFIDILFVILLMYYNVCHIVFWDYNCSFAIFLTIYMTISTSNGILLPNKDLQNVNKWWWFNYLVEFQVIKYFLAMPEFCCFYFYSITWLQNTFVSVTLYNLAVVLVPFFAFCVSMLMYTAHLSDFYWDLFSSAEVSQCCIFSWRYSLLGFDCLDYFTILEALQSFETMRTSNLTLYLQLIKF
jgi:hypothetical protein